MRRSERAPGRRPTASRGSGRSTGPAGGPGSSSITGPSTGVYLASWRRVTGRTNVPYAEAVEEALCVGWVDATGARSMTSGRSSGSRRAAAERVGALEQGAGRAAHRGRADAAGRPCRGRGGQAARHVDDLDEVEDLVVPDDLAAAFDAHPPARTYWDAFSKSARRAILEWIRQAKRPETRRSGSRRRRRSRARNEKANQWVPPDQRG